MAKLIKGVDRKQLVLFNECIEDRIAWDSEVRVIDMFVETLVLEKLGFTKAVANEKGTNHYDDADLLKLYLYGYKKGIRSSRKLEELCETNIEVMWLVRGLKPDFRTIAKFRQINRKGIKKVFKELIITCKELELITKEFSQDGVKIEAVNSKEENFTLTMLDDRIKKIEEYLKSMDEEDKKEEEEEKNKIKVEELEKLIEDKKKNKEKYEKLRKELEESGESQISLTDKESKLMKNNGKFSVCYNNQVLVDAGSDLVINYKVSNNPADIGSMEEIVEMAKEMLGFEDEVVKNITDKGYNDKEDMAKCLEEGIIPEVTLAKGTEYYEIEVEYEKNEITEEERKSEKKEDIKKVLRAGKVPEVYEEYISNIRIEEKSVIKTVEEAEGKVEEMSTDEIRDFALKNKCFMKDKKTNRVYCPEGEILRKKSKNGDGYKYCNKEACRNCKNPCTNAKYKEAVFKEEQIISTKDKKLKKSYEQKVKKEKTKETKVIFELRPKKEDIKRRFGISEHTHGTMKRTDGAYYFLTKGKESVETELALYYCASNLRRMKNILTAGTLIEKLEEIVARKKQLAV